MRSIDILDNFPQIPARCKMIDRFSKNGIVSAESVQGSMKLVCCSLPAVRMPRRARVHAQPCLTLMSQNDTVICTSDTNSGGVREGVGGCTISVSRV